MRLLSRKCAFQGACYGTGLTIQGYPGKLYCRLKSTNTAVKVSRLPQRYLAIGRPLLWLPIADHEMIDIVHLRDFKCHMNQTDLLDVQRSESGIAWRYYLEYAPYGDLENLRMRYRAFHRYLPELFLWHVFDSLARAIVVLEDLRDLRNRTKPLGKYMTHCDIKPQNIFLGYEEHHDEDGPTGGLKDGRYPTIKLGDFGLAELQDEMRRGSNFKDMAGIGTLNYLPPVSRSIQIQAEC